MSTIIRRRDVSRFPRINSQNSEPERLVKQTYSVHVSLPADRHRGIVRKWHLSECIQRNIRCERINNYLFSAAYFSQEQLNKLATIDSIRGIGDVAVPDGWFRSARANKNRNLNREPAHADAVSPGAMILPVSDSYPGHPSMSYRGEYPNSSPISDYSRTSPSSSATSSPTSTHSATPLHARLVPLEFLQNSSTPRRNPVDEQLIRQFNSLSAQGSFR